jgi:hypothetical protein
MQLSFHILRLLSLCLKARPNILQNTLFQTTRNISEYVPRHLIFQQKSTLIKHVIFTINHLHCNLKFVYGSNRHFTTYKNFNCVIFCFSFKTLIVVTTFQFFQQKSMHVFSSSIQYLMRGPDIFFRKKTD